MRSECENNVEEETADDWSSKNVAGHRKTQMYRKWRDCSGAYTYLFVIAAIYFAVCLILGKPEWIISVFTQNFASDLKGELPRMMATLYFDKIQSVLPMTDTYNLLMDQLVQSITAELPAAFLFSSIDSFIISKIKMKNFKEKLAFFG